MLLYKSKHVTITVTKTTLKEKIIGIIFLILIGSIIWGIFK